jgi:hypothetical protein
LDRKDITEMMDSVDFNVAFINILIDLKEKQHNEERNE